MENQLKVFGKNTKLVLTGLVIVSGGFGFLGARAISPPRAAREPEACAVAQCVSLLADRAAPDTVTIPLGSSVQFNSEDGKKHSLSLGKGGEEHDHSGPFSSGDFDAQEAWRVEFKEQGSFFFHDHYNPKINILVVVYTPGGDYRIP